MGNNNDRSSATRRDYIKYTGAASAAAMTGLAGCSGGGGGEYPDEDITYIIPFSEGGGTDTYARQFISHMADELGTNMAIENVPGTNPPVRCAPLLPFCMGRHTMSRIFEEDKLLGPEPPFRISSRLFN